MSTTVLQSVDNPGDGTTHTIQAGGTEFSLTFLRGREGADELAWLAQARFEGDGDGPHLTGQGATQAGALLALGEKHGQAIRDGKVLPDVPWDEVVDALQKMLR
jgi:hypothetical protein